MWSLHQNSSLPLYVDPKLVEAYDLMQSKLVLQLDLLCSHPDPNFKPSIWGYFPSLYSCFQAWDLHVATLLWKSVRMRLTLPKWGLGSPLGLRKLQSSIAGVKTPHIGAFSISLKSYQNVDVEMGSHEPFGHLQHKLWQKERLRVKLSFWLPTTKSQESTRPQCVQGECDTLLEISRQDLQPCFKPHPNQRS